ncbi:MAG: hypothetical protein WD749_13015 [Phycisphaerales bacterium]
MAPSPPRQPEPRRTTGTHESRRRRGMVIASLAGAAGLGTVAWFVLAGAPDDGSRADRPVSPIAPPTPAPASGPRLVAGNELRFDLADRKDPNRHAGQLVFAKLDPLEGHHYAAEKPRATLFLKDGRTVHIQAAHGRLYMPEGMKEPESGSLGGGVLIRMYEARADGARVDPDRDPPTATVKTESLVFDGALGRMDTPDRVTVETDELWFAGRGLRVIFNQVRERLELVEIAQGEEVRFTRDPDRARAKKPAPRPERAAAPPRTVGGPAGGAAPVEPSKAPVETLYKVVFSDAVVASHEQRTIHADALTAWARLLDGSLPEGAIAEMRAGAGTPQAEAARAPGPGAGAVQPVPGEAPLASIPPPPAGDVALAMGPPAPAREAPLVMRWTGPCTITPMEEAPPELKDDHVALRFTAERTGHVALADESRSATGECAAIDYFATTRRLGMSGGGPKGATLRMPGAFRMAAERMVATVRDDGTVIHIPGASEVAALEAAGQPALKDPMTVTCTEQADITVANSAESAAGVLRQAIFQGSARVADASGWLKGDSIRAEFAPWKPEGGGPERSLLTRVVAEGNAAADAGQEGMLKADAIDASFRAPPADAPGPGDPEPTGLAGRGNVHLEKGTQTLTGDLLDATLARDAAGKVQVSAATVRGNVRYADTAERVAVAASCEELAADFRAGEKEGDPRRPVVDLRGPRVELRQSDKKGESTIVGTHVQLDGVQKQMRVFGAGEFDQRGAREGVSGESGTVHAAWTQGMSFDHRAGVLTCDGRVVATSTTSRPDAQTRDRIEAHGVRLTLAPESVGDAPAEPTGTGLVDRLSGLGGRLLTAEAWGSAEGGAAAHAQVESRRFAADPSAPDGKRLAELYYVEGSRILADNVKQTVDVPGTGKLLILDRRAPRAAEPGSADRNGGNLGDLVPSGEGGRAGSALFDWRGSMHLDRAGGWVRMKETVNLTHQRMDTRDVTNVSCNQIDARFKEAPVSAAGGAPAATRPGGELVAATATGSVYMTSGPERTSAAPRPPSRELAGERVEFDAIAGTAEASAREGDVVRFYDPSGPSPVTAKRLVWNLATGHVRVIEPGPVAAPKPK